MEVNMTCPKCSREIPEDALFCCYCGKKLAATKSARTRGNGTGTVYKRPDGKYQVTVTLGYYMKDGIKKRRTVSRTYAKKADAIAAAVTLKGEGRPDPKETLLQLHDLYIETRDYQELSRSQQDKLSYAWARLEPLYYTPIAALTVDDLQRTVDGAVSTYYPARDIKVMLSHLYTLALRREIVPVNKARYVELPDAPKARREVWTDADIDAMWADYDAGQLFTGYVLIMCYCGLRYGELAALQLENIHLDERYMIGGIKTEAGIDRTIPIAARILPVIARFYEHRKYKLLEISEDSFYQQYDEMIKRLGLRDLPPQTARHYYFSMLTAAGIQAGIITETGGHASYLTTMKNYVRIPLADKLAAVDKIHPAQDATPKSS